MWSSYKWRFVPWLAYRLSRRPGAAAPSSGVHFDESLIVGQLLRLLCALERDAPATGRDAAQICNEQCGFWLTRRRSGLDGGGTGVFVAGGGVGRGQLVALYPGTIYNPGNPALLASLRNQFMFRCLDGVTVDGNDRALSRSIFRSCAGRDQLGPYAAADSTWLNRQQQPLNNLAVGQYVNNHNTELTGAQQNVQYEELWLHADRVPLAQRRFLPYVYYEPGGLAARRAWKIVVLIATTDIAEGHELFSSYFTVSDTAKALARKCKQLADLIRKSRCTVVFTGAGISTSASIPDYRGPNGIWTLADKGKDLQDTAHSRCNPASAVPTSTHLALRQLYSRGYVRHILSQNCDGLHLRSGVPQTALSEIHGNMYIEICTHCTPHRQYIRSYDVTAHTRFRRHQTGRRCDVCNQALVDSIVHFGEWGKLEYPLNWKGATTVLESDACELIVVLGSSLKILSKYEFLWPTGDRRRRVKMAIVNLQWTPKDRLAHLKINGHCDGVMHEVMQHLQLATPSYCRLCDPVLDTRQRNSVRTKRLHSTISECGCGSSSQADALSLASSCEAEAATPSSTSSSTTAGGATAGWWAAGFALRRRKPKYTYKGVGKRRRAAARTRWHESSEDSCTSTNAASNTNSRAASDDDGGWSSSDEQPLCRLQRQKWARIERVIDAVVGGGRGCSRSQARPVAAKRPVGRPKKRPSIQLVQPVVPKRPVGRPRKRPRTPPPAVAVAAEAESVEVEEQVRAVLDWLLDSVSV